MRTTSGVSVTSAETLETAQLQPGQFITQPMFPAPITDAAQLRDTIVPSPAPLPQVPAETSPTDSSRLDGLRERLRDAARPVTVSEPTPKNAADARASALSLIGSLRSELEAATAKNRSLAKELEQTKQALTRAVEEASSRTNEARRLADEIQVRASLLEEAGQELTSLENERNDVLVELRGAQSDLSALKAECAALESKAKAQESELAAAQASEQRLEGALADKAEALRQAEEALRALTSERDALAAQVAELTRERVGLLESRMALDEIHRALAEAASRIPSN